MERRRGRGEREKKKFCVRKKLQINEKAGKRISTTHTTDKG